MAIGEYIGKYNWPMMKTIPIYATIRKITYRNTSLEFVLQQICHNKIQNVENGVFEHFLFKTNRGHKASMLCLCVILNLHISYITFYGSVFKRDIEIRLINKI